MRGRFATHSRRANALPRPAPPAKLGPDLNMKLPALVTRWMPPIAWMLIIFAASTDLGSGEHTSRFLVPLLRWFVPDVSMATLLSAQFFVRKAAHVTEYAILGALLWRALVNRSGRPRWHYAAVALAIAACYAAFDEYHQTFVATRTGTPRDVLIDICGAIIGLAVAWAFTSWRAKPLQPLPA